MALPEFISTKPLVLDEPEAKLMPPEVPCIEAPVRSCRDPLFPLDEEPV